jgi:hypothetical protein
MIVTEASKHRGHCYPQALDIYFFFRHQDDHYPVSDGDNGWHCRVFGMKIKAIWK